MEEWNKQNDDIWLPLEKYGKLVVAKKITLYSGYNWDLTPFRKIHIRWALRRNERDTLQTRYHYGQRACRFSISWLDYPPTPEHTESIPYPPHGWRSGTASWVALWEPLLVPSNGYDIHKLKHGITTKPLLLLPGKPVITKRVCTKLLDLWLKGGSQTLIRQRWSILADQVYLDALLDFKLFS